MRKEKDTSRQRRIFSKHLEIIQPLKDYYTFLKEETDIEVVLIHYLDVATTKSKVLSCIDVLKRQKVDGLKTFEQIENWLNAQT